MVKREFWNSETNKEGSMFLQGVEAEKKEENRKRLESDGSGCSKHQRKNNGIIRWVKDLKTHESISRFLIEWYEKAKERCDLH